MNRFLAIMYGGLVAFALGVWAMIGAALAWATWYDAQELVDAVHGAQLEAMRIVAGVAWPHRRHVNRAAVPPRAPEPITADGRG